MVNVSALLLLSPKVHRDKTCRAAFLFQRRLSRFMKRQSPRIVFLYRPEIKRGDGAFRIVKPCRHAPGCYLGVSPGKAGVDTAAGAAVEFPLLWGGLGCQPMTRSSAENPIT